MSQHTQRISFMRRNAPLLVALSLCAIASYAVGLLGNLGDTMYQNTAPSLVSTAGDVTLTLTHTRYLTTERINVTLTNQSNKPIYLLASTTMQPCTVIQVEIQDAQGWESPSTGCDVSHPCASGTSPPISVPAVRAITPGEALLFPLYDGQFSYPLWNPGVYRFSVKYSRTPFQARGGSIAIPQGVTLSTTPVTLTWAWWNPPWYHRWTPCPRLVE